MINKSNDAAELHERYRAADPFPHLVLDGFLIPRFATQMAAELDSWDVGSWFREDDVDVSSRRWMDDPERLPSMVATALRYLNSEPGCDFFSALTGIDGLEPDPVFRGGGVSAIPAGGRLKMHPGFDAHPDTGMRRRVTALIFLNKDWHEDWNGQLEIWPHELDRPVTSIYPVLNRLFVCGPLDDAHNRIAAPVACPTGHKLISMTLYYYTAAQLDKESQIEPKGKRGKARAKLSSTHGHSDPDDLMTSVSQTPSPGRDAVKVGAGTPRVSVFTPSHRTRFLDDCLRSLLAQTFQDWEWIVVLNQGASWRADVEDPRVRIVASDDLKGVGAAKQHACSLATGEFLVELDHDDKLSSDALAEVVRAFDEHPDVGFVYSHCAQIQEDGARDESRFDERHGWVYRETTVDGQSVLQYDSPEAFPQNVSYIWYAPNHVRAFRRDIYERAGGYDVERDVLDDQDLMCRIYAHTDFHLIPKCLYLQRVHRANTQRDAEINARIQRETIALYDRYVESNALSWAKRRGFHALDLGAAHNKPPGYKGVDQYAGPGVDIVGDVSTGIDLPDSSVGVIRAVDFLEHIPDKIGLFNELYRLLAHGGMVLSLTPSTDGRGAFQDPTHIAYYNENSFWYFTDKDYARFVPTIKCRFQTSRLVTYFPNEWHEQNHISYICANLIAIKDGPRQGGFLLI